MDENQFERVEFLLQSIRKAAWWCAVPVILMASILALAVAVAVLTIVTNEFPSDLRW